MSVTSIILIAVVALFVLGAIVLVIAMFSEMGKKRTTGQMKSSGRNKPKSRKNTKR